MELKVDLEAMTIGDLEDFEDIVGQPLGALDAEHFPAKAIKALVFLTQRRDDPSFTLEQARSMRVSELTFADPPEAATNG